MRLEFETEKETTSNQYIYYKVKRKGLEVGTLILKKEPYAQKQAQIKTLRGE